MSDSMQLTQQQLAFFETFGFLKFPGLLADRIGDVIDDFEGLWAARGGGHAGYAHDGKARSCIFAFIDQTARLATLLDDPRILGIAKSLLGDDFNYMGSDGNYYVGDTAWHSDGWHERYRHIKIAFYLDPVTATTGALRVIPGSHVNGDRYSATLNELIYGSVETIGTPGSDIPAYAIETVPGDILVFNHNIKHAAFGGTASRRMFTINLCQHYQDDDLQILRDYIGHHARFWVERLYAEPMVSTAGSERMRHLEQPMANDGGLAELSRQARETMAEPARG